MGARASVDIAMNDRRLSITHTNGYVNGDWLAGGSGSGDDGGGGVHVNSLQEIEVMVSVKKGEDMIHYGRMNEMNERTAIVSCSNIDTTMDNTSLITEKIFLPVSVSRTILCAACTNIFSYSFSLTLYRLYKAIDVRRFDGL